MEREIFNKRKDAVLYFAVFGIGVHPLDLVERRVACHHCLPADFWIDLFQKDTSLDFPVCSHNSVLVDSFAKLCYKALLEHRQSCGFFHGISLLHMERLVERH